MMLTNTAPHTESIQRLGLPRPTPRCTHPSANMPARPAQYIIAPAEMWKAQEQGDCPTAVMLGDLCAVIALAFLEPLALVSFFQLIGA